MINEGPSAAAPALSHRRPLEPRSAGRSCVPSTDQTFDNSDQLTAITEHKGSATLASFTYKRASIGTVMSIDPKGVPGGAESYGYSKLNQLATLDSKPNDDDPAGNLTTYAHDPGRYVDPSRQCHLALPTTCRFSGR